MFAVLRYGCEEGPSATTTGKSLVKMFEDAVCIAYCTDAFARKFELCVQTHKVLNSLRYPLVSPLGVRLSERASDTATRVCVRTCA